MYAVPDVNLPSVNEGPHDAKELVKFIPSAVVTVPSGTAPATGAVTVIAMVFIRVRLNDSSLYNVSLQNYHMEQLRWGIDVCPAVYLQQVVRWSYSRGA